MSFCAPASRPLRRRRRPGAITSTVPLSIIVLMADALFATHPYLRTFVSGKRWTIGLPEWRAHGRLD